MNYYTYAKKDFNYLKKKYKIKLISNLHDLNKLRYALVLKPKNTTTKKKQIYQSLKTWGVPHPDPIDQNLKSWGGPPMISRACPME